MSILPTVKVIENSPRGWRIINQSDFDPKVHVVFGVKAAKAEPVEPKKGKAK